MQMLLPVMVNGDAHSDGGGNGGGGGIGGGSKGLHLASLPRQTRALK